MIKRSMSCQSRRIVSVQVQTQAHVSAYWATLDLRPQPTRCTAPRNAVTGTGIGIGVPWLTISFLPIMTYRLEQT